MPKIGENALLKMAPVLERLAARQPAYELTAEPQAFLRALGEDPDDPARAVANLGAADERLVTMFEPMLGVTFTPTRIRASEKINVIPSSAELKVDCRVPPGLGEEQVRRRDRRSPPPRPATGGRRASARSADDAALADRLHRANRGQPLADLLAADGRDRGVGRRARRGRRRGAGDPAGLHRLRHFREAFPECVAYGFFPQRHQTLFETAPLIHAADERIDARDLAFATEFFRDLALRMLDARDRHNGRIEPKDGEEMSMESGTTTVATTTTGTATTPPASATAPVGTAPAATTPAPAAGSLRLRASTTTCGVDTARGARRPHPPPRRARRAPSQAHAHAVTKVTPIAAAAGGAHLVRAEPAELGAELGAGRRDPVLRGDHRRDVADAEGDAESQAAADQAGLEPGGRLEGHRGRRRRARRAGGDRRVPARPEAVRGARREGAEGDPPARAAGDRQDAAGEGGRARVRRAVLRPVGGGVRGDVRGPRRRADQEAVRDRPQARTGDHLHRRARRGRRPPRDGHLRREGPDAQPVARGDGRLRRERARGRDRGVEPARQARPGAAAPGALRPPGVRRAAGRARTRRRAGRAHAGEAAGEGGPLRSWPSRRAA